MVCKQRSIKAKARRLLNKGISEELPPYEMEAKLWERMDYLMKVQLRKAKNHHAEMLGLSYRD